MVVTMVDSMVARLVVKKAGYLADYLVVMTADSMVEKKVVSSVEMKAVG